MRVGCGHGGKCLCQSRRGARQRDALGHGDAARQSSRGTRIKVGITGSLKQILFGPAQVDDGSQNLVGAITTCMGNVGAASIREFQETEIIIAPSIKTEENSFRLCKALEWAQSNFLIANLWPNPLS